MAKGSGSTRGSSFRDKQSGVSPSMERGKEMYGIFLSQLYAGGFLDVQSSIDSSYPGSFMSDTKYSENDLKSLDTVFEPIGAETSLYKGSIQMEGNGTLDYLMAQTGAKNIESLVGKSYVDKFYSSLSKNKRVAEGYAYDAEYGTPVVATYKLGKSAKIAKPSKHGWSAIDDEITLGRNQKHTIESVKLTTDKYGDDVYQLIIRVG